MRNFLSFLCLSSILCLTSGCTEAENVRYNLSQEADNFNPHMWLPDVPTYID